MEAVNLMPFIDVIGQLVAIVLGVLAPFAIKKGLDALGVEIDHKRMGQITSLIDDGIGLAKMRLAGDDGKVTANIKNDALETALEYVVENGPKLLKALGVSPETKEGRQRIEKWIEARL